jgi:hypothetical protein
MTTSEKLLDIINQFVFGYNQNLSSELPKIHSLVSRITKVRKQNNVVIPSNLNMMPQLLRDTLNNGNFLYFENLNIEGEKILIYTTYSNLIHLENTDCWVEDRTFYDCPYVYAQVYTIQGCVRCKSFRFCTL